MILCLTKSPHIKYIEIDCEPNATLSALVTPELQSQLHIKIDLIFSGEATPNAVVDETLKTRFASVLRNYINIEARRSRSHSPAFFDTTVNSNATESSSSTADPSVDVTAKPKPR
jgi:hypothetical protein